MWSLPDNIKLLPSAWNIYPTTENPSSRFKFFSAEFTFKKDLKVINRVTYSVLDYLGDCGGLVDALVIIGQIIANPFAVIALKSKLAWLLVRYYPKPDND